jgi:nitroimidazol reductase NimA-like FMN-containing flavoprotein (pyridoxamine 5'-phosphate oxidase superfamily)
MSEHIGQPLEEFELEQRLQEHGLGVLGVANDGDAYTFPIAFVYDADADRCLFRFLSGEESMKRRFAARTATASLTIYDWNGVDDWLSIVVRGPLQQLADDEVAEAAALFSDIGEEGALEVFNEPVSAYETAWYELVVQEKTGRIA